MAEQVEISDTIRAICREGELLVGIPDGDDFFDYGVSSLAVIQMQVRIEGVLGVTVPTAALMGQASINEWIDLYSRAATESLKVGIPGLSSSEAAQ